MKRTTLYILGGAAVAVAAFLFWPRKASAAEAPAPNPGATPTPTPQPSTQGASAPAVQTATATTGAVAPPDSRGGGAFLSWLSPAKEPADYVTLTAEQQAARVAAARSKLGR